MTLRDQVNPKPIPVASVKKIVDIINHYPSVGGQSGIKCLYRTSLRWTESITFSVQIVSMQQPGQEPEKRIRQILRMNFTSTLYRMINKSTMLNFKRCRGCQPVGEIKISQAN